MSGFPLKTTIAILMMLLVQYLPAQQIKGILKSGDQLYEEKEYAAADKFYKKAFQLDSTNASTLYKYGKNLSRLNNFPKASRYLLKSSLLGGKSIFDDLAYELGEAYRRSGKYRKALRQYRDAIRPYRRQNESYWYKKINQAENSAEWAENNKTQNTEQVILNFGKKVNSSGSDYAATIKNKTIYFTTIEEEDTSKNKSIDKKKLNRIYFVNLESSRHKNQLKFNQNLAKKFSDKDLANLAFGNKDSVFFSVCDSNKNCNIYTGILTDNKITKANKLNKNINTPSSNNTQAYYVKHNGKSLLYFVSDRPGGFGGLDIWVSEKKSYGFDEAVNLGNKINSPGNEITPFYDAERQLLYFSSDWHEGFGGFDIFKAAGSSNIFNKVENLKKPINSYYNDYYFQLLEDTAIFSSNRREGNIVSDKNCCNDIFKVNYQQRPILSEIEKDSLISDSISKVVKSPAIDEIEVNVALLNTYLPLQLYFHNDIPNPRTRDSTTSKNYLTLAYQYAEMQNEYITSLEKSNQEDYTVEAIRQFFEKQLKKGIDNLERFMPLLLKELEKGNNITLSIKGFSSSLFSSDYNYLLAHRRIESLINYMKSYRNGALLPYINNSALNGGSLDFKKIPYGDFAVKNSDFKNETLAVYSDKAALQRKIEIIAVNKNIETDDKISFNRTYYNIGTVQKGKKIKRFFEIRNAGKNAIKIYHVNSNCNCAEVQYPSTLKGSEEGRILVSIDSQNISGKVNLELIVVTNTQKNLHHLNIDFEVIE